MFDDKFFNDWLDGQAQKVMEKVAGGEAIAPEQMMILMLKAQTNHFAHLDIDLRNDMQNLDKRFEQLTARMDRLRMDNFIIGSFATTIFVGGVVIAAIKLL